MTATADGPLSAEDVFGPENRSALPAAVAEVIQRASAVSSFQPASPAEMGGLRVSGDREIGCGICHFGMVVFYSGVDGEHPFVCACVCDRGRAKQQANPKLQSVQQRLSEDELLDYWPKGAPIAGRDRVVQLLVDGRVPPQYLPWSLTSYGERFKADREQKRYLKLAGEWLGLDLALRSDLILFGPNGTGKTGLAVAMARAMAEAYQPCLFWTMRELAVAWRDTYNREAAGKDLISEQAFVAGLVNPPLLILDEVSGQRMSEFVEDSLTMIVDLRQKQKRPTILTLNVPAGQGAGIPLGEGELLTELLGPTLQDRLRERGQFWALRGQSKRKTYGAKAAES